MLFFPVILLAAFFVESSRCFSVAPLNSRRHDTALTAVVNRRGFVAWTPLLFTAPLIITAAADDAAFAANDALDDLAMPTLAEQKPLDEVRGEIKQTDTHNI